MGGVFVMVLNANWEVSRGLRSPVLETRLVSRPGRFVFKTWRWARRGTHCRFLLLAIWVWNDQIGCA